MNELLQEQADKAAQLKTLEARRDQLAEQNDIGEEYRQLTSNIGEIEARLGEITNELSQQKAHEERVTAAREEITYLLDNLTVDEISMRNLCLNLESYNLLRACVQQEFVRMAEKHSEELKAAESREAQLQRQNDHLQEVNKQLEADLAEMIELKAKEEFERIDAERKRDAAVKAKENVEELLKLKQEELDLERIEKAVGARKAPEVINQSEEMRKLAAEFRATRIKVINMRPVENDFKRQTWEAEDAETGEKYVFNHLEKGRYTEVSAEDAARFRAEREQAKPSVPDIPLDQQPADSVAPEDSFPVAPPSLPAVYVPSEQSVGEVVAKSVEERLDALERAVFGKPGTNVA